MHYTIKIRYTSWSWPSPMHWKFNLYECQTATFVRKYASHSWTWSEVSASMTALRNLQVPGITWNLMEISWPGMGWDLKNAPFLHIFTYGILSIEFEDIWSASTGGLKHTRSSTIIYDPHLDVLTHLKGILYKMLWDHPDSIYGIRHATPLAVRQGDTKKQFWLLRRYLRKKKARTAAKITEPESWGRVTSQDLQEPGIYISILQSLHKKYTYNYIFIHILRQANNIGSWPTTAWLPEPRLFRFFSPSPCHNI